MDSDNLIFPFILLILIGAWFYIFKIMPPAQTNSLEQVQETLVPSPSQIASPIPTPAPATLIPAIIPTPFATKPSINIPGGGEFENDF